MIQFDLGNPGQTPRRLEFSMKVILMRVILSVLVVLLVFTAFMFMSPGVFADHGDVHVKGTVVLEPKTAGVEETAGAENTPADPGIEIFAFLEEPKNICGESTTTENGAYDLELAIHCTKGTLGFALMATGDVADTTVSLPKAEPDDELNIVFAVLSFDLDRSMQADQVWEFLIEEQRELRSRSATPSQPKGGGADDVNETLRSLLETIGALRNGDATDESLIKGDNLVYLLGGIVGSAVLLLALMVFGRMTDKSSSEGIFRQQIEGLILVLVVVAVIVLGVTEKIGDQGLVSILAAIAGYAVGRSSSASGNGQQPAPQPAPIALVPPTTPTVPVENGPPPQDRGA